MRSLRLSLCVPLLCSLVLAGCPGGPDAPAPEITSTSLPVAVVGVPYGVDLEATGGSGARRWSLTTGGLPVGIALSAQGRLEGTPLSAGEYALGLRVLDEAGQAEATLALSVVPALTIASTSLPDAAKDVPYSERLEAAGGRAPYRWRLSDKPAGLALALSEEGVLAGTPTITGSFPLLVEVTDATDRTARTLLVLKVHGGTQIATTGLPDAYRNETYTQQLTVTGEGPATWSVASGSLPTGLSLTAGGSLSGRPTVASEVSFTVRAVRSGEEALQTLSLGVYELPSLTAATLEDAYVGSAVSQALPASGGKGQLTFSAATATLPAGLTLATDGLLTGIPGAVGRFSVAVTVADENERTVQAAVELEVLPLPELVGGALPDAELGQPYDATLVGSGGRAPLGYAVTSGALPRGVVLSPTGRLSGHGALVGTSTFAVTVTDANGRTAQALRTLRTQLPANELGVVSWNLEWFGHPFEGPDNTTQQNNARNVLLAGGWDVAGLVEIVDQSEFHNFLSGLVGYSGLVADEPVVIGGSANYGFAEQKPALIWRTSAASLVQAEILPSPCIESTSGSDAYAGRSPLEVVLQTTGSPAVTLNVLVVHMKAGSNFGDYLRRKAAATCLKDHLDGLPSGRRAMVIGDFNDDVDVSITGGQPTPYQVIVNSAGYSFPTAALSAAGLSSTTGFSDMVDHHLINAALAPAYVAGSAQVVRPDLQGIADYAWTTSDHYPVATRYALGGARSNAPHVFINEVRYSEPSSPPAPEGYAYEFVELVNAGDASADLAGWAIWDAFGARHVFTPGTTLAPGKAIVVFGGASAVSASGLTNGVGASSGGLSFHPTDSMSLRDATGNIVDGHAWSSDRAPGLSDNRATDGVPGLGFLPHDGLSPLSASPGLQADGSAF